MKASTISRDIRLTLPVDCRYHKSHLWIIDVSQSVEHDHPRAFDFLRADLQHVDDYFAKHGVATLGLRKSFDFVIREGSSAAQDASGSTSKERRAAAGDSNSAAPAGKRKGGKAGLAQLLEGTETNEEAMLDSLAQEGAATELETAVPEGAGISVKGESEAELMQVLEGLMQERDEQDAQDQATEDGGAESGTPAKVNGAKENAEEDSIFKQSYIPRTLNEVYDPERDVDILTKDGADKLIYATATGMDQLVGRKTTSASQSADLPDSDSDAEDESGEDGSGDSEEDSGSEGKDDRSSQPRGHRHEDRDEKKERKKAVKEEAREKRQHKMKKKEKKRLIKKANPKGR